MPVPFVHAFFDYPVSLDFFRVSLCVFFLFRFLSHRSCVLWVIIFPTCCRLFLLPLHSIVTPLLFSIPLVYFPYFFSFSFLSQLHFIISSFPGSLSVSHDLCLLPRVLPYRVTHPLPFSDISSSVVSPPSFPPILLHSISSSPISSQVREEKT